MDSIEGVDYIFDRYAFLQRVVYETAARQAFKNDLDAIDDALKSAGLPFAAYLDTIAGTAAEAIRDLIYPVDAEAPKHSIETALKGGRAAVHPDRFNNVAVEILREAKRKRDCLDRCAEILLDETKRENFNVLLAKFREEKSRLISRDGYAILDMASERLFIDDLLDDEIQDMGGYEDHARQLIQFSESRLQDMKALYDSAPDNPVFRRLYKEELGRKLLHCEMLETSGWARLGYLNKKQSAAGPLLSADDYATQVDSEIGRVREAVIDQAVAARSGALALGLGKPFLLLGPGNPGEAITPTNDEALRRVAEKARQNLDLRSEFLRQAAMNKQQVLEALMNLIDVVDATPRQADNPDYQIVIAQPDATQTVVAQMPLDASTGKSSLETSFPGHGLPFAEFKAQQAEDARNVVVVLRNSYIGDILLEAAHIAQDICNDWDDAHEAALVPSPQPGA